MTLNEVVKLAEQADAESRLATNFYDCALDAQAQLCSRRENLRRAHDLLQEGRTIEAGQELGRHLTYCPDPNNVYHWFEAVSKLHDQARKTREELIEALDKLRAQEEARVRHGGISIEIPDEPE